MSRTEVRNPRSTGPDVPLETYQRENPMAQQDHISDCKAWHIKQCRSPDVIEYIFQEEQENYYGNTAQGHEDVEFRSEGDPTVNIGPYDREGTRMFLCKTCKKEFIYRISGNTDDKFKVNDPAQYPRYLLLQVTDTGKMLRCCSNSSKSLRSGDHVAWISKFGFIYHHAIVTKVYDGSFECMEWSHTENKIINVTRADVGISVLSPMFKVQYPDSITYLNPPHLVLARARARYADKGYELFFDNCEHFASFCKTGNHFSSQIAQRRFSAVQFHLTVLRCLRIFMIVIISEIIEYLDSKINPTTSGTKHAMADTEFSSVDSLIVIEMVYMIITLAVLHLWDIPQTKFKGSPARKAVSCGKLFYVHVRIIMRSGCVLALAVTFNFIAYYFGMKRHFSPIVLVTLETVLATIGGFLGLLTSIVVFDYLSFVLGSYVYLGREATIDNSYQSIS